MITTYSVPCRLDEGHCLTWYFAHLNSIVRREFQKRMMTRSEKAIYAEG